MVHNLYLRFPGGKSKALTLSYDDGVEQDVRLVKLMDKYHVRGTFNLNSGKFAPEGTVYPAGQTHRRMTKQAILDLYKDSVHEVAVHTSTHPSLTLVPTASAAREVTDDREVLEEMFQIPIRGMAYPNGAYDDSVVDVLRMCGIAYARTTISSYNFDLPTEPLKLAATCHHNNPTLMELADEFLNTQPKRDGYLFYLWGHAYEFEDRDNWDVIEKFLAKVSGKEDVWYATNIEIIDYINAYRRLELSVDMRILHNPTALDLYVIHDRTPYRIPAGGTVYVEN